MPFAGSITLLINEKKLNITWPQLNVNAENCHTDIRLQLFPTERNLVRGAL